MFSALHTATCCLGTGLLPRAAEERCFMQKE